MGKCTFNRKWLADERFSDWIKEFKGDKHSANCVTCNRIIDLGKMGEYALTSHMNSKRHINIAASLPRNQPLLDFMKVKEVKSSEASKSAGASNDLESLTIAPPPPPEADVIKVHSNIRDFVSREDTLKAETLWTIHTVVQHNSYKSNDDVSKLFPIMFPDSKIANKFTCGERKTSYISSFGISEYFKQTLLKEINGPYSVMFDESLNKSLQSKQMDVHVRFWNPEGKVTTRYFTSQFLGHGTANDMVDHFTEAVIESDLNMNNLIQIGMDGPNVNWKFYDLMSQKLKTDFNNTIINVGSCGLHVMNNSFQSGAKGSGWNISSLLSSLYYLFKDSPARREDYMNICQGKKMPLKFCQHRWLENEPVAKRAIEIWSDLILYVKKVEEKKFPKPTCKSYTVLEEFSKDKLVIAKLEFFKVVASFLKPYLTFYQSDKPVLPLMTSDLCTLLRSLLRRFIKPEVLDMCDNMEKLSKIDITNKDNLLSYKKVDIGINASEALQSARTVTGHTLSDKQVMEYRMEARQFLSDTCKKILHKCPLSYSFVRNLSSLNPLDISNDPHGCQRRFKKVLISLKSAGKVGDECDIIAEQYNQFVDSVSSIGREKFAGFSKQSDGLDMFYTEHLSDSKYDKLLPVVKLILVISHGQASVERGFSVNKEVETVNLSDKSVVARRIICDYVQAKGGILNVVVSKGLMMSVASARNRYDNYLDDERKKNKTEEQTRKRKSTLEEIDSLKSKKKVLKTDIEHLVTKADKLAKDAERTGKITFITQSNALRNRSKEKMEELKDVQENLDKTIQYLAA